MKKEAVPKNEKSILKNENMKEIILKREHQMFYNIEQRILENGKIHEEGISEKGQLRKII